MSYAGHQINIRGCEIISGKNKQLHTKKSDFGLFLNSVIFGEILDPDPEVLQESQILLL